MSNGYYDSMPVQDAIDQRIWETRVVWWNGEVRVFEMWREGDECYCAGPTESGYRFRQIVKVDGFVGVRKPPAPASVPDASSGGEA